MNLDLSLPPKWTLQSLCAQTDPAVFFPEIGGSTYNAKAICRRCPVSSECLAYALGNHESYGIWGGTDHRERRAMNRRAKAA